MFVDDDGRPYKPSAGSKGLYRKGKKELVSAGLRITDECQSSCIRQLCVAKQIADDIGGKSSIFRGIAGQEFHRAKPVIVFLPVRFDVVWLVHTFKFFKSPFSKIRGRDSQYGQLSQCLDPASSRLYHTTDYATVVLPLPGISNDLEVVRLL